MARLTPTFLFTLARRQWPSRPRADVGKRAAAGPARRRSGKTPPHRSRRASQTSRLRSHRRWPPRTLTRTHNRAPRCRVAPSGRASPSDIPAVPPCRMSKATGLVCLAASNGVGLPLPTLRRIVRRRGHGNSNSPHRWRRRPCSRRRRQRTPSEWIPALRRCHAARGCASPRATRGAVATTPAVCRYVDVELLACCRRVDRRADSSRRPPPPCAG